MDVTGQQPAKRLRILSRATAAETVLEEFHAIDIRKEPRGLLRRIRLQHRSLDFRSRGTATMQIGQGAGGTEVRFLLAGDAWPAVLEASLDRLLAPGERLAVNGFKLAHHGSVANVSESLLGKLSCANYLISTNGAIFRHPHARCVELLLKTHGAPGKPRLHFNYLTPTTEAWRFAADQAARGYQAFHPKGLSLVF